MKTFHATTHTNLHLTCVARGSRDAGRPYWYLITSGAISHDAFETRQALLRWLDRLRLTPPPEATGSWDQIIPEPGARHASYSLMGSYRRVSWGDYHQFYLRGNRDFKLVHDIDVPEDDHNQRTGEPGFLEEFTIVDNGTYTLAFLREGDDRIREIHHLNCNLHYRIAYPYGDARTGINAGL